MDRARKEKKYICPFAFGGVLRGRLVGGVAASSLTTPLFCRYPSLPTCTPTSYLVHKRQFFPNFPFSVSLDPHL